jgi:hypothetical protein
MYTLVAAVVLPILFVIGAEVLGDRFGMLSVAIAWAVGYPIAFGVLLWLSMQSMGWAVGGYLRSIGGVGLCMLAGGVIGAVAHWGLGEIGLTAVVRLIASTIVIVGVVGVLLACTQGISIRSVIKGPTACRIDRRAPRRRSRTGSATPPPRPACTSTCGAGDRCRRATAEARS